MKILYASFCATWLFFSLLGAMDATIILTHNREASIESYAKTTNDNRLYIVRIGTIFSGYIYDINEEEVTAQLTNTPDTKLLWEKLEQEYVVANKDKTIEQTLELPNAI